MTTTRTGSGSLSRCCSASRARLDVLEPSPVRVEPLPRPLPRLSRGRAELSVRRPPGVFESRSLLVCEPVRFRTDADRDERQLAGQDGKLCW